MEMIDINIFILCKCTSVTINLKAQRYHPPPHRNFKNYSLSETAHNLEGLKDDLALGKHLHNRIFKTYGYCQMDVLT